MGDGTIAGHASSFLTTEGCSWLSKSLLECCCKWFFNAVSTGAHVLLGKAEAETALLRSIYELDELNEDILQSSVAHHILTATPKERVVPTAIVMGKKCCTVQEAKDILSKYSVIRHALSNI